MHFESPLSLAWLAPIGGLIVLMYILKLRRKDVTVSSTMLWRQVIRDVQANAPFQKLRKNLLLLLQLIVASMIILALARPLLRGTGIGGRNIVVIVDTSASMRSTDVSPSRLDAAKQKAHALVAGLRPGDRMMILSAYSRPENLTGFTNDSAELNRAVENLKPHDTPTSMREALNLSASLVASRNAGDNGTIDLISDGGFEGENARTSGNGTGQYTLANLNIGKAHVAFYPIGVSHDNVGITAMDFRRELGEEKKVQLLVVSHNFATESKKFNEEIYADDNLVEAHEIVLAPNSESVEPYDLPEPEHALKMRVRLDVKDDLASDNEAYLILKPRKTLKVLLVGRDNPFLENALKVDSSIDLSKANTFASGKGYDVVVFNESAPAKLPEGNYLFLHCTSDQAPVKTSGAMDNVAPADWERDHPILRYVDFGTDRFGSALKAETLGWGQELAVAESGSLISVGEKNHMRSEFIGFSLTQSLFPLRVAFPIFMANSVRWLGTGNDDSELGQVHTGDAMIVPAPAGAGKISITKPDGSVHEVVVGAKGGAVFPNVDQVGFYQARGKDFAYPFAASLASPSESDITPHKSLAILDNPTPFAGRRVQNNVSLLPWLTLIALLVLAVEWWAFHRRVFVS